MSLLRLYKFDNNAANTNVLDASGNAQHGTLGGGDTTSAKYSATGPGTAITSSMIFNGTDDDVTIPEITLTGVLTVSYFAKRSAIADFDMVIGHLTNTNKFGFSANGTTVFARGTNGSTSATPLHGVTSTDWHHYTYRRTAANLWEMYVDSSLISADIFAGAQAGSVVYGRLVNDQTGSSNWYGGWLAWLKIYDSLEDPAVLYAERNLAPTGNSHYYNAQQMAVCA